MINRENRLEREVCFVAKIGIEPALTNVQQALEEKGYEVIPVHNESDIKNVDCCVVSGLDSNFMGIQNISMEGSIIDANGMSADEVCREVESKLNLH
nr:YkuS family protein [Lederbergia wuyishanensis]